MPLLTSARLSPCPIEIFPALSGIDGLIHGFLLRNPDIDVDTGREEALQRLRAVHEETLTGWLGISHGDCWFGEQVHGCGIAVCPPAKSSSNDRILPGVDGLITGTPGVFLGVYVADCCAVFLADPFRRACGLVHSGRTGSELGIAPSAIRRMTAEFGSAPADLVVQMSPCIRPPAYETDFADRIRRDCRDAGVPREQIHDSGICTSSALDSYYSYRAEKGRTGRMLAVIGWRGS